jgi:hypothetical protein
VVHCGGVPIDGRSSLGADVAVPGVEIECTDAVFAAGAPELHAALDPISDVVSHGLIVVLCSERRAHYGEAVEGNAPSRAGCQRAIVGVKSRLHSLTQPTD